MSSTITIRHRNSGAVIYTGQHASMREAVEHCVRHGISLRGADLSGAVLIRANLIGANLTEADLTGADLTGADLTEADLTGADLTGADLILAKLSGAVLAGAIGLPAAPVVERPHVRILEALRAGGKLDMGAWHKCATTHCRAGWLICFAGEPGAAMEAELGSSVAGALIAIASCPALKGRVPDWFAPNEEALADIERLAKLEA